MNTTTTIIRARASAKFLSVNISSPSKVSNNHPRAINAKVFAHSGRVRSFFETRKLLNENPLTSAKFYYMSLKSSISIPDLSNDKVRSLEFL